MLMWITVFSISVFLSGVFLFLGALVSKESMLTRAALSPFECGFSPISEIRDSFSLRFFIFAVIFVIFDVELILVIPSLLTWMEWTDSYMSFIMVMNLLTLGLFLEWNNEAFEWIK